MSRDKDGFGRWDGICVCHCVCEYMSEMNCAYELQKLYK